MTMRIFTVVCFLLCAMPAQALETKAKQALIVDGQTGQTLFEKNARQQMPTSSMSKVMTMYMVFDALQSGKLSLDTELMVSEKAWRKGGSKMFVEVGKSVKVEDLIRGVIIQSGNDATIVLAEGLMGDEDVFASNMTAKAKELGMINSNFVNASGWPDPDHYSTAADLITLSQRIVTDFPEYFKYYGETDFEFNDIKQPNRNPLLYQNIGADGLKTGHTEVGGYGLMGAAIKNGRRVFMVINGLESEQDRAQEAKRLMLWALNSFSNYQIFSKGQEIEQVPVRYGKEKIVSAVVEKEVLITLPTIDKDDYTLTTSYKEGLEAPIAQGDLIGQAVITLPQEGKDQRQEIIVDIHAGDAIDRKGFMGVLFENISLWIKDSIGQLF